MYFSYLQDCLLIEVDISWSVSVSIDQSSAGSEYLLCNFG